MNLRMLLNFKVVNKGFEYPMSTVFKTSSNLNTKSKFVQSRPRYRTCPHCMRYHVWVAFRVNRHFTNRQRSPQFDEFANADDGSVGCGFAQEIDVQNNLKLSVTQHINKILNMNLALPFCSQCTYMQMTQSPWFF
jgi:hypothetical protein